MALNTASYSYEWAANVVKQLENKHPRAAEIFYKNWEVTPRMLAKYLARSDPVYPYLRERIKYLSLHLERGTYSLSKLQYLEWERSLLALSHGKKWRERLDTYLKNIIVKEQCLRQRSGGLQPDGSQPSTVFPLSEVYEYGQVQYCLPFGSSEAPRA